MAVLLLVLERVLAGLVVLFGRLVDDGVRVVEGAQHHPERVGEPEGGNAADCPLPRVQQHVLRLCNGDSKKSNEI